MTLRRCLAALFFALPPTLLGCGQILGIGDVELANDASVSPGGGDGSISGDGSETVAPETGATGLDSPASTGDDSSAPSDDGGTGAADASDSPSGACAEGATRCSGSYAVETCAANDQWGAPVDCPIAMPYCSGGACGVCATGATTCSASSNGVETCDAGAYGAPVACDNSACFNGSCTGSCAPASTQCTGDAGTTPETCGPSGTWQTGPSCAYVCEDGGCTGTCTPGALTCSGQQPQKCDSAGTWQNYGSACPILCTSGICTGSCTPGTGSCNDLQPQKCTDAGAWQNNGGVCPYVCDAGGCSGVCAPSSADCSGDTPRTCSAGGTWQSGSPCPYVCDAGSCGGVCAPNARECVGNGYVTCSSAGEWGTTPTACSNSACSDGGCVGDCTPGNTECSGTSNGYVTCLDTGTWGTTVTGCTNSTCSGGTCEGICAPGQKQCDPSTDAGIELCADGGWGSPVPCASGDSCSNGACTCSGGTICGTGCVATQTDPNNCGTCGHSCLGGTCSGGLCQPVTIAAMYGGTFNFEYGVGIDTTNIYFTTGPAGQVGVCPLTGCTVFNPSGGATIPTYIYTAPAGADLAAMLYDVGTGTIYASDPNNGVIYSISTAGSLNWTITGRTNPGFLATDGANLYWGETAGMAYISLASNGTGTVQYLYSSPGNIVNGAWYDPTSADLFGTVGGSPGNTFECPVGGSIGVPNIIFGPKGGVSGTCTVGSSTIIGTPEEVLVAEGSIYFGTQGSAASQDGLFTAPVSNPSQITAMVTGTSWNDVLGMTADSANVYFSPYGAGIFRCPLTGCGAGPITLATGTGEIDTMVSDSQYLYWGSTEKVMKLAK